MIFHIAVKASLFFKLSNGMVIQGAPRINVGTYEYIFQGSELQSPGKVAAVITLEYNEGRVSSCGFTFNCRAHPLFGKGFEAGPYIADLEKIVQQAQEQVDYLNELIEMMHEALNETVLTRADLVNNGETTQAGFKALDAAMGKTIMDQITQLNGNLAIPISGVQLSKIQFEVVESSDRALIAFVVDGNLVYRVDFNGTSKFIAFQKYNRLTENNWKTIGVVKFDS